MKRRTTVELDDDLLARAKRALGGKTTRATVEEGLRRVAEQAEGDQERRAADQLKYLEQLPGMVELNVLAGDEMWR